jgi:molecular chaperone GrpE
MPYIRTNPSAYKIPIRTANGRKAEAGPAAPNRQSAQPEPEPIRSKNGTAPAANDGADKTPTAAETDWQARTIRLQADMDNFRKRQTRRADEAIAAEQERLLRLFLPVADNLTRALNQDHQDETLRQGVELTYREFMRRLEAEGVTRIETVDQPFDPNWHEALAALPGEVPANTIIEEVEAGYKLRDKLLRPARVVVAA